MGKFDGIIFDVDGTLWDSTGIAAASYNKVLEREGISTRVTAEQLQRLFGKPMDEIFATLFPELEKDYSKYLADACMDQENEDLKTVSGDLYPDLLETMQKLAEKYPLFIVSNCQCGYIELVLKHGQLEPLMKDYLCFGDTGTSKGQTILTLMKRNGLTHPVYVGDTQGDADASAEAGIPIIFCAFGFGTVKEPYKTVNGLKELLEIL